MTSTTKTYAVKSMKSYRLNRAGEKFVKIFFDLLDYENKKKTGFYFTRSNKTKKFMIFSLVVSVFRYVHVENEENREEENICSNLFPLNDCCLKPLMTETRICCDESDKTLPFDQIIEGFCSQEKFGILPLWEDAGLTRQYVKLVPVAKLSKVKTEK